MSLSIREKRRAKNARRAERRKRQRAAAAHAQSSDQTSERSAEGGTSNSHAQNLDLQANVTVVPRLVGRTVVVMEELEFVEAIPHTTVLLPSGNLLACHPTVLLKLCAIFKGTHTAESLVGSTVCIEIPEQLPASDEDFMIFFDYLHENSCVDVYMPWNELSESPVTAFLIGTLKVTMMAKGWPKIAGGHFGSREPEDPTFGLWWSLLELLVKQKLIRHIELFCGLDGAGTKDWLTALKHRMVYRRLHGGDDGGIFNRSLIRQLCEFRINKKCNMYNSSNSFFQSTIIGPEGKKATIRRHLMLAKKEVKQRVFEDCGIAPELQAWEPDFCSRRSGLGWERTYIVTEKAVGSVLPSARRKHFDTRRAEIFMDKIPPSAPPVSHHDSYVNELSDCSDLELDDEQGENESEAVGRDKRGNVPSGALPFDTPIVFVLPTGERITCDALKLCRQSTFLRELVMQAGQQMPAHGQIEIPLIDVARIPVKDIVSFFRQLQRPGVHPINWKTTRSSTCASWARLADYLQVEILSNLGTELQSRLRNFKLNGAGNLWTALDAWRAICGLSSTSRRAAIDTDLATAPITPKDMYHFLSDVELNAVISLTVSKKQQNRLEQELGDFYDEWLVEQVTKLTT